MLKLTYSFYKLCPSWCISHNNLIFAPLSTEWLGFEFFWIYWVSSKMSPLFLSLTPGIRLFLLQVKEKVGEEGSSTVSTSFSTPHPHPPLQGTPSPTSPAPWNRSQTPSTRTSPWGRHSPSSTHLPLQVCAAIQRSSFPQCVCSWFRLPCAPWCRSCYCSNSSSKVQKRGKRKEQVITKYSREPHEAVTKHLLLLMFL